MNKRISVIIPVYKVESYLSKCIESVIEQTYKNLEIILIDDGSPDQCPQICDQYAKKDNRIVVIHQQNKGLSGARNTGLMRATGEYIAFLDSDDFIEEEMYEVMYQKALEKDSDIVECNLKHDYKNTEDTEIVEKIYEPRKLLMSGRCVVWNKIYKREWLMGTEVCFPEGLIFEDLEFMSKLIPYIRKYDYVDIAPIHYVQRKESLNNYSNLKTLNIIQVLNNISTFYKEKGFYEEFEKALEYLYIRILLCSSFSRMCRIKAKEERKYAIDENWRLLVDTFPKWKSNEHLLQDKRIQGKFMRTITPFSYKVYSTFFPFVFNLKSWLTMK